ncbi:Rad52/Rad22 family DNA repair protein [Terribacillus sp. JSM ZJ617]|uniref:Rad52/Rad22 family DNA repair protein n=1 Tax=Terribacillus sp. JSM ZJ617 TaxID=3342119 RepID=UPI0035A949E6
MGRNLDFASIEKEFNKPFREDELGWRVLNSYKRYNKVYVNLAAYVDSRAIMKRLDSILGINGWEDIYEEINDGFKCGIRIYITDEQSRTKWDGAPLTDFESVKGGMSNAFKRAATKWGIGRYLYDEKIKSAELLPERRNDGEYIFFQDKKKNLKGYYKVPSTTDSNQKENNFSAEAQANPKILELKDALKKCEYKLGLSNNQKSIVKIFNKANGIAGEINVNRMNYINSEATETELKNYYLALKPLYNICMAAEKFRISLDEMLKFAQIIKPELSVTNVFSLLFNLSNAEVMKIYKIAESEYNNKKQAM